MLKKNQEFVNASFSRKRQIINWLIQELGRSGSTFLIDQIKTLMRTGDQENINQAIQLTKYMILDGHKDDTLKYIFQKNIGQYGLSLTLEAVIQTMFSTFVSSEEIRRGLKTPSDKTRQEVKGVKKTVTKLQKEDSETKKIFGLNKQGKKREAELDVIFVRGQSVVRLRDVETGTFLKNPRDDEK